MITDDPTEDLLTEVLARRADDRPDAHQVISFVHGRIDTSRPAVRPAVLWIAVAAAVVAIATASMFVFRSQLAAPSQPATAPTEHHPGMEQLTQTCLNMAQVLASWGNPSSDYGGVADDRAGRTCSHEADVILPSHPATKSTIAAGSRTVYVAQSPKGIRTGFIALTPTESAAAAAASGQDPNHSYYFIVSIPADNPQPVLASILQQYQLP